jgi:hypothetical protein
VGGINTTFQTLRDVALSRGDTFHILASDPQKSKQPGLFPKRKQVRGGDTFITIDGQAPHHPSNVAASVRFLRDYDLVITSYISPHPTKAYGNEPLFMPLLEGLRAAGIRMVGYIHDAYWETYKVFGELALPLMEKTMVCQPAYGDPLVKAGYPVSPAFVPFRPILPEGADEPVVARDPKLVAWIPQWKNIKGVRKFFQGVPEALSRGYRVEMYGNGIEYYKMRLEPSWAEVVGVDHFAPKYSGAGGAEFFGCVPLTQIADVLSRASFMPDFQGHSSKWQAYKEGSYNHTIIEALYYGAVPVVHPNMLKSAIPAELLLPVSDLPRWADVVAQHHPTAMDRARAREFVLDSHSADKLYDRIIRPGR